MAKRSRAETARLLTLLQQEEDGPRPGCFSPDEWDEFWKLAELGIEGAPMLLPLKGGFCQYCDPEWQLDMQKEDLCSHPETVFWYTFSSGWEGTRTLGGGNED